MICYKQLYPSPIGDLSLVASDLGLLGVWFIGQAHFERGLTGELVLADHPVLAQTVDWLDRYFAGQEPAPTDLPLAVVGTDFQQRVWAELAKIPYGQTTTYKALADKLNCPSAQAVGGAVGRNPLSIIVPCHRVLGADGSLTGYAGGLDKKIWLLEHEGGGLKRDA
ncbi:methylated-DNA-[protein]-cysteine S-methyltransferase [Streptococcus rupicaprae]|uniref:Methylated-DNA--protein-cysteine methyltransferase n=1 Tax=Streptococcus rupicaprae TaxID=759619 RepID=A0ABV2FII0_9STRE